MTDLQNLKVAIHHYWWLTNRGGEAVVKSMVEVFPDADIVLHVCDEKLVRNTLGDGFKGKILTTFISRIPFARRFYQGLFFLMPLASEAFDFSEYDLVISVESGPTKGAIVQMDAKHVCYCLSPMRYIWDLQHEYLARVNFLKRIIFKFLAFRMRIWDGLSSRRVDEFLTISRFVQKRVKRYYGRDSKIIYPPVNVSKFTHARERSGRYLFLGQLVEYKRAHHAVQAFNRLGLPLTVVGDGPLLSELKSNAKPHVKILGRQPDKVVQDLLETSKALIFPGVEDFGIVPVEAIAAGTPVIALNKGGAMDTVTHNESGILYDDESITSLVEAVMLFEKSASSFVPERVARYAEKFDERHFKLQFEMFLKELLMESRDG